MGVCCFHVCVTLLQQSALGKKNCKFAKIPLSYYDNDDDDDDGDDDDHGDYDNDHFPNVIVPFTKTEK